MLRENGNFDRRINRGNCKHRERDTRRRKRWGRDRAFKVDEEQWRDTFLKRSLIPAHPGNNPRIVILPFIPNISLVDLLEKFDKNKFKGEYEFGQEFESLENKLRLVQEVGAALHQLHEQGKTWGDVTPCNIGLTSDGKIIFFNPETPYTKDATVIEQKARDLFTWCVSACGALNNSELISTAYGTIIKRIFEAYGDQGVIDYLQLNLCDEVSGKETLLKPIAWNSCKERLTLSDRKQFNQILNTLQTTKIDLGEALNIQAESHSVLGSTESIRLLTRREKFGIILRNKLLDPVRRRLIDPAKDLAQRGLRKSVKSIKELAQKILRKKEK